MPSPPGDAVVTILGPTMAAEEVAARKVLALFDRAEARDFVDVYRLVATFDRDALLRRAQQIDLGFDIDVFIEALHAHRRYDGDEFPSLDPNEVEAMRGFFTAWAIDLSAQ